MEIRTSDVWTTAVQSEHLQNDRREVDKHRQQFRDLTGHVGKLRQCIEQERDDTDYLQQDRETILERLDRLDETIDLTEMTNK